jgi:hypothetical protein
MLHRKLLRTASATLLLVGYLQVLFVPVQPWVYYWLNKQEIATQYCINRDQPALVCDGKCYLKTLLREANGIDHQLPKGTTTPPLELNLSAYTAHTLSENLAFEPKAVEMAARAQYPRAQNWALPSAAACLLPEPPPWA